MRSSFSIPFAPHFPVNSVPLNFQARLYFGREEIDAIEQFSPSN